MNQATTGMPVSDNGGTGAVEDDRNDPKDPNVDNDVEVGTTDEVEGQGKTEASSVGGAGTEGTEGPEGTESVNAASESGASSMSDAVGESHALVEHQPGAAGDTARLAAEHAPDGEAQIEALDQSDAADATGAAAAAGGKGRRSRLALLEREGEVAADFLEQLLDIADLDGDIDVDIDGDRAAVAIVDSEEGRVPRRLVGPDGRVLEALQELTRLAVQTATGERSRLMLDVAGYRAERRSSLVELARTAIEQVRASGEQQALADMSAFERKVVHDEVTAAGLVSESEGIEPHRHIVIRPS